MDADSPLRLHLVRRFWPRFYTWWRRHARYQLVKSQLKLRVNYSRSSLAFRDLATRFCIVIRSCESPDIFFIIHSLFSSLRFTDVIKSTFDWLIFWASDVIHVIMAVYGNDRVYCFKYRWCLVVFKISTVIHVFLYSGSGNLDKIIPVLLHDT